MLVFFSLIGNSIAHFSVKRTLYLQQHFSHKQKTGISIRNIALVTVIGFSMIACGNYTQLGKPTLTNFVSAITPGQLIIQNFNNTLIAGQFISGEGLINGTNVIFLASFTPRRGAIVPLTGNIVLNVYKTDGSSFTENGSGYIRVHQAPGAALTSNTSEYVSAVSITFTNGNAIIDFNTQMKAD